MRTTKERTTAARALHEFLAPSGSFDIGRLAEAAMPIFPRVGAEFPADTIDELLAVFQHLGVGEVLVRYSEAAGGPHCEALMDLSAPEAATTMVQRYIFDNVVVSLDARVVAFTSHDNFFLVASPHILSIKDIGFTANELVDDFESYMDQLMWPIHLKRKWTDAIRSSQRSGLQ